MDVGVVFGGRSVEHEVSIITAHQMMAVLSERHNVVPIYIARDGRWWTGPELNDLDRYQAGADPGGIPAYIAPVPGGSLITGGSEDRKGGLFGRRSESQERESVDLDVVVCAVHGTYGEDGTLQGLLELADLPYTGSGVLASAVGLDKVAMKTALRAAGLPVVHDIAIRTARFRSDPNAVIADIESKLDYPVFV